MKAGTESVTQALTSPRKGRFRKEYAGGKEEGQSESVSKLDVPPDSLSALEYSATPSTLAFSFLSPTPRLVSAKA